ncbi:MAG TPA: TylF/MycF/NovP-related O-methyltransferase [Syntrophorhabdaceae bacterium]|nr:TylF/MycF/NovP-related O-methyltransferase [Syntrophorhabdaceae bacterium]
MKKVVPEGGFRTEVEKKAGKRIEKIFNQSPDSLQVKLDNFPRYIRRQKLTRLLTLYEIFKKILPVKGSIIECGVYGGFSLMAWANMSAVLEPANLTRRIYGFDTFSGFPSVGKKDSSPVTKPKKNQLRSDSFDELTELLAIYNSNRFLGHIGKVQLIKGDVVETIPKFVSQNRHLIVSLLFLDLDLYEPTKTAIENFFPRMPKGAIIAFDELDNPIWPGETRALLETIGVAKLRIERIEFDPYIGFAVIG